MPDLVWLDEVDLDPAATPVSMGTRSLGDRPWLVTDAATSRELSLKAELCRARHAEVFAVASEIDGATIDDHVEAGAAVLGLLSEHGVELVDDASVHPLDRAGRSVQEDLCLLRRVAGGWHLAAASLCFPSRWRLADKIGRHITAVHGPVAGYADRLAARVDGFLDRLGPRPVWRRNWFIHPDAALFQPDRPPGGDPVVPAAEVMTGLWVRSERQTLRRLDPLEEWILFTIRVQQATVGDLVADGARAQAFRRLLATAPADVLAHRGMPAPQVRALQTALA